MGERDSTASGAVPQPPQRGTGVYSIRKHGRAFAIYDPSGILVCVVVYLKGAREVVRRLGGTAIYIKD